MEKAMDGGSKVTELNQREFQLAKDTLDKLIKKTGQLAEQAEDAMVACCRSDELDARDEFAQLAGLLAQARGLMLQARSVGGGIKVGDSIVRGGST